MPNISNLNDPTFTTLIPDQIIASSEHNSWRTNQVIATIKDLNDVVADLESNYASVTEPGDKPEGKIYCNTTNDPAVLQFYKDGASGLHTIASLEADNAFTGINTFVGKVPLPRGHIDGLTLSNDAGDTAHDINVAAGECRDSSDTYNILHSSEITKQIDATWAAGDDAGGMEDGDTVGNAEWFHVHLLGKSTDPTAADIGFDTSVTAVNILADAAVVAAGYDIYRRIGSVLTDGSANIIGFTQDGDRFRWKVAVQNLGEATVANSNAVTIAVTTPTGIVAWADLIYRLKNDGGNAVYTLITALDETDTAPSSSLHDLALTTTGQNADSLSIFLKTDASSQIRYRVSFTVNTRVSLTTKGWIDRRGRG